MHENRLSPVLHHTNLFDAVEAELDSAPNLADVLLERDHCEIGLPGVAITVRNARDLTQDRAANRRVWDAVWAALVQRAQDQSEPWEHIALRYGWLDIVRGHGGASDQADPVAGRVASG